MSTRTLVLIAGKPSHPPGEHEFRAGCRLLARCLSGTPGLTVRAFDDGWAPDEAVLDSADAIVIYSDGGAGHPILEGDRLEGVRSRVAAGAGFGLFHYAVELPVGRGAAEAKAWTGGYYEDQRSCNPIWDAQVEPLPDHPVTRGVSPFHTRDEWYINIQHADGFSADRSSAQGGTRFWPILVATPSDEVRAGPYEWPHGPYPFVTAASGRKEALAWAVERPDGGRGVGLTGGHFHANWGNDQFRKVILNALVWVTGLQVPTDGVASHVTTADLVKDLDHKSG